MSDAWSCFSVDGIHRSYSWLDNDTIVACVIPEGHGPAPQKLGTLGPKVQDNSTGKKMQSRTFTDLLKVGGVGIVTV
jgi:hypothetical protein